MNWMRDWVYRVISPFLTQLKNRLDNIKIENNQDGTSSFTNASGVKISMLDKVKEIPFETNKWLNVLEFKSMHYGTSFRLTITSLHGGFVVAQKLDVIATHSGRGDIVVVHNKTYGDIRVIMDVDSQGSGAIYMMPTSGDDQLGQPVRIQVDDFVGKSYEIGGPKAINTFGGTRVFDKVLNGNEGINTRVEKIRAVRSPDGTVKFYDHKNALTVIGSAYPNGRAGVNFIRPDNQGQRFAGAQIGVIVIKYPFTEKYWTMAHLQFVIYNYRANSAFKFSCGGYNYSTPRWYNSFGKANSVPDDRMKRLKMVRFLKPGGDEAVEEHYTHFGILVGDGDLTWSYGSITLESLQLSHQNITHAQWATGWSFAITKMADLPPYRVDFDHLL